MKVEIFDVDHGACSLITTAGGQHMLLDCGHKTGADANIQALVNALQGLAPPAANGLGLLYGDDGFGGQLRNRRLLRGLGAYAQPCAPAQIGWRPSTELKSRNIEVIDKLTISNYDEDHLSDLPNIVGKIYLAEIFGNPSISMQRLRAMKPNGVGNGAAALIDLLEHKRHTFKPRQISGAEINWFWVNYGANGLVDTNNLSVVTFVTMNDLRMIFPGDIEAPAWEILLGHNDFLAHLSRVNVFVASHHGRENGYHSEAFRNGRCSPVIAVISDKSIIHSTQESAANRYGRHVTGMLINGDLRKVLTTRNDGCIRFSFNQNGMARVDLG